MPKVTYTVIDDIESEPTVDTATAQAAVERFAKLFFTIECVGDTYKYGCIYNRSTGRMIGGWMSFGERE